MRSYKQQQYRRAQYQRPQRIVHLPSRLPSATQDLLGATKVVASGTLGKGAKAAKDTVKDKVEDVQEAWETSQVNTPLPSDARAKHQWSNTAKCQLA